MNTETDLAYLAGLIDGEGSITISVHNHHKNEHVQYRPRVSIVANTNPDIIAEATRILESVSIAYHISDNQPRQNGRYKHLYQVECDGFRRALKALFILEPHLRAKRRQGQMVLAFLWLRATRMCDNGHSPYSDDELTLINGVRELNKVGSEILREHTLRAEEISVMVCSELRAKGAEVAEMTTRLSNSYGWRGHK